MKTILVTGATGFLGQSVIYELLKNEDYQIVAIGGRPEDKVNPLPKNERVKFYILEDLFSQCFHDVDTVINCAFARSNDAGLLAQALEFTERLINRLEELKVKSVINLSSQGVYERLPIGELSKEESPIAPMDLYSMAKYATEKMFALSTVSFVTNVRLASLMMPQRFLYFFVQKAKRHEMFTVTSPRQGTALLDVSDAAAGLAAIVSLPPESRSKVYNLGIGKQYSVLEYANDVKAIGGELGFNVDFDVVDNGSGSNSGMDCSLIMSETGWKPRVMKEAMIKHLFSEGDNL